MRKTLATLLTLLLCASAQARGQTPAAAADAEKEAVKKVVETYLYAEEPDERRGALLEDARIFFVDREGKQGRVESVSKRRGETPKGARVHSSRQRIVSMDVMYDGASVKVETVLGVDEPLFMKHTQYLWLLKTESGWKIAGILMPSVGPVARPGDR